MPSSVIAVPLQPGVGASVDLSTCGYDKTFLATGHPGLDALIECSNDDTTYVPVGRLVGEIATVLPLWGQKFRIRRIDGQQVSVNCVVKAASSLGTLRVDNPSMLISDGAIVRAIDHLQEPVSLMCWVNPAFPGADGEVAVAGINGGQSVRIGTLAPGQSINIDGGADFDSLSFTVTRTSNVDADFFVSIVGKTPDASLPEGIIPYMMLVKFTDDSGTSIQVTGEAARTRSKVTGISVIAPGHYRLALSDALPLSTGGMEFASIAQNDNIFFLTAYLSDPQNLDIECRNLAGVLTQPGGLFQGVAGVLLY